MLYCFAWFGGQKLLSFRRAAFLLSHRKKHQGKVRHRNLIKHSKSKLACNNCNAEHLHRSAFLFICSLFLQRKISHVWLPRSLTSVRQSIRELAARYLGVIVVNRIHYSQPCVTRYRTNAISRSQEREHRTWPWPGEATLLGGPFTRNHRDRGHCILRRLRSPQRRKLFRSSERHFSLFGVSNSRFTHCNSIPSIIPEIFNRSIHLTKINAIFVNEIKIIIWLDLV